MRIRHGEQISVSATAAGGFRDEYSSRSAWPEALLLLDWERKKAPLVPPNGQGLGALPDLRRSLDRWWDLIYEPCRHAVAARDCDGGSAAS